jgi:hypothetical protein
MFWNEGGKNCWNWLFLHWFCGNSDLGFAERAGGYPASELVTDLVLLAAIWARKSNHGSPTELKFQFVNVVQGVFHFTSFLC